MLLNLKFFEKSLKIFIFETNIVHYTKVLVNDIIFLLDVIFFRSRSFNHFCFKIRKNILKLSSSNYDTKINFDNHDEIDDRLIYVERKIIDFITIE